MPAPQTMYVFTPSERAIFAEIYFPKKVVHQPAIFNALRDGHDEQEVKRYLGLNAQALLGELKEYKGLFDPHRYEEGGKKRQRAADH